MLQMNISQLFTTFLAAAFVLCICGDNVEQFLPHSPSTAVNTFSTSSFNKIITEQHWEVPPFIPLSLLNRAYDAFGPRGMLTQLAVSPNGQRRPCHIQAHNAGKVIWRRATNLTEAFYLCVQYCQAGCFHGFAMAHVYNLTGYNEESQSFSENRMSRTDTEAALIDFYRELCGNGDTKYSPPQFSHGLWAQTCYHGLGHAIVTSVAEMDAQRAMEECKHMEVNALADLKHGLYHHSHLRESFKAYMCATGSLIIHVYIMHAS